MRGGELYDGSLSPPLCPAVPIHVFCRCTISETGFEAGKRTWITSCRCARPATPLPAMALRRSGERNGHIHYRFADGFRYTAYNRAHPVREPDPHPIQRHQGAARNCVDIKKPPRSPCTARSFGAGQDMELANAVQLTQQVTTALMCTVPLRLHPKLGTRGRRAQRR